MREGPEGEATAAQARVSLRAAADRAVALGSFEQAITHLEDALAVAGGPAAEAVLLSRIGEVALLAGLTDRAEEALRRAVELARTLGDSALAVRATADLASALLIGSQIGASLAELEPVADDARALGQDLAAANFAAVLAQTLMRSGRFAESVEWADRAIHTAERQQMEQLVAQALVTKATSLTHVGRFREGMVLLDGATRFAEDRGFNMIALRGQVNLSASGSAEDPRAALEYVRRGVALSQRLGIRTFLGYHVGNGYGCAIRTGDWAWFDAMTQEVLAILGGNPGAVQWGSRRLAAVALWRGVPAGTEFEDEMREAREAQDPQTMAYAALALGHSAYIAGDFEECVRVIEAGMADRTAWPYVTALGGRAAILGGDLDRARSALAVTESLGPSAAFGADAAMLRAGIDGLEGRRAEALAGYRTALTRYRDLGLRFDEALTATEIVAVLGPADPDVVALADAATATLRDLGAGPVLARLEALLAGARDSVGSADREVRSSVRLGDSIGAGAEG
jgi:tetratricopeptide (TPR) repeat protein